MESTLLLNSSSIFDNSTTIDRIRQSFIDLNADCDENEVEDLLTNQLIPYLENFLSIDEQKELFSLILSCFSYCLDKFFPLFDTIYSKSRSNSNFIIITALIIYCFSEKLANISKYESFVSEGLEQVQQQIKSPNETTFQVFGHEIPPEFCTQLIVDLLICSKLTKELVSDFSPYILSHYSIILNTDISKLFARIVNDDLSSSFPQPITIDTSFFNDFSQKEYIAIIPHLSEETFKELFERIESLIPTWTLDPNFSLVYLDRCCKYNMKIKTAEQLISPLSYDQISSEIWTYLKQFNFVIPFNMALDLHDFPDRDYLFRIIPKFSGFPETSLSKMILECKDFNTYDQILFVRKFEHDIFHTQEFWNHILSLSSHSECPKALIPKFSHFFKTIFDIDSFSEIIDEMIFSNYPLNEKEISFISYFLVSLRSKYREVFTCQEHMNSFLNRVLQKNVIPLPRFWELVTFDSISEKLKYESKPLLLYGYEFARGKHYSKQTSPSLFYILKQSEESKEKLIEFIQKNNTKYIVDMNEEALSLIASAFIFTSLKEKVKIDSLTKKNILPFFAICFNYLNKCNGNLNFTFDEYSAMFLESVRSLANNESPLLITSIDSILSHASELSNEKLFPQSIFLMMIEDLISILFKDQYKADKMVLLSALFYLSNNLNLKLFFENHGKELFNFILKYMNEIAESDKFKDNQLNIQLIGDEKYRNSLIFDYFKKSNSKESRNMIYFLSKMCKNMNSIMFNECDFYVNALEEAIIEKNYKDLLLLDEFRTKHSLFFWWMKKNMPSPIEIPLEVQIKMKYEVSIEKIRIDDLLSIILNDPKPESNKILFDYLFKVMMKDESISVDYIAILLENFYDVECLNPKTILTFCSSEYENYKNSFIEAMNRFYLYDQKSKTFIKRPDFDCLTLPVSQFGVLIISKLFKAIDEKPGNYQAFFCLRSIANSFPFLFIENPQQVFDHVLPVLNDLPLLSEMKDVKDEEIIKKIKTVSSALSFLLFSLSSVKIFDDFINWFFANLNDFSISQIFGFILIIRCILGGRSHLIIYLKKFNFIEIFMSFLKREIPTSFKDNFITNVFQLFSEYYAAIPTLSKIRYISLDTFNDVDEMFFTVFDHCIVHLPTYNQPTSFLDLPSNEVVSSYIKLVDEIKPYYFTYDYRKNKKEIDNKVIDEFVNKFIVTKDNSNDNKEEKNDYSLKELTIPKNGSVKDYIVTEDSSNDIEEEEEKEKDVYSLDDLPIPKSLTIKMIQYVTKTRQWIIRSILCHYQLTLLPEHYEVLIPIVDDLNEMENDIINNYRIEYNELYSHDLFKFVFNNHKLLNPFLTQILKNDNILPHFYDSIEGILNEEPTEQTLDIIFTIFDMLPNLDWKNKYFQQLSKKMINVSLEPHIRTNINTIQKVAQFFLLNNNCKFPIEISHLIGFLLISNDNSFLMTILRLCNCVGFDNLKNVIYLLERKFWNVIDDEIINYESIGFVKAVANEYPELLNRYQGNIYELLKKKLHDYFLNENSNDLDLFICLIKAIAPKKRNDSKVVMSDQYLYDIAKPIKDQSYPIVPSILKSQSTFWGFYESIQPDFVKLLNSRPLIIDSFPFLYEFPEVLDFNTRSKSFLKKMKASIFHYDRLFVIADRMDIIGSSYDQLKDCTPNELKKRFNVNFIGEEITIDEGGVTANWLFLLTQQLFNPINGLFDSYSTNGGYKPSSKSSQKPNHLKYFKFAGRIIARTIMENVCVDCHMAPFFYKCILHHPIKLGDMKELDEEKYNSINWCLTNDIDESGLELYYDVDIKNANDEIEHIELIENGSNIRVTNENKEDYAIKLTEFYLIGSIKEQIDAFCQGFDSIIPHDQIDIFTQGEMDLLICGISEFTDDDFKKLVKFESPYNENTPVIKFFFSAVSKWSKEDRAKLLLFITSTSKFPANINKNNQILITYRPRSNFLPIAHTCFRQLELPEYESEQILNDKLLFAVQNCNKFALA